MRKPTPLLVASLALLSGCASPTVWYKSGATSTDFERDKNRCIYEANLATANYNTGPTARTQSGAIGQGLGEGIAIALRQRELYTLCMTAAGYTAGSASGPPSSSTRSDEMSGNASTRNQPTASSLGGGGSLIGGQAQTPLAIAETQAQSVALGETAKPATGSFSIQAERLALNEKCHASPIAKLTASGPGFESYTVACANGDALAIRCDFGTCRALK